MIVVAIALIIMMLIAGQDKYDICILYYVPCGTNIFMVQLLRRLKLNININSTDIIGIAVCFGLLIIAVYVFCKIIDEC